MSKVVVSIGRSFELEEQISWILNDNKKPVRHILAIELLRRDLAE